MPAPSGKIAVLGLSAALTMTAGFEGLRNYSYLDPVGIWTICYGSTDGVKPGQYLPTQACLELLGAEYLEAVEIVQGCIKAPLRPNELAAFTDMVYNAGPRPVCDRSSSQMARLLAAGRIREACGELTRWVKGRVAGVLVTLPGLVRRRTEFRALCEASI